MKSVETYLQVFFTVSVVVDCVNFRIYDVKPDWWHQSYKFSVKESPIVVRSTINSPKILIRLKCMNMMIRMSLKIEHHGASWHVPGMKLVYRFVNAIFILSSDASIVLKVVSNLIVHVHEESKLYLEQK